MAAIREAKEETGLDIALAETENPPHFDIGRADRSPAPFCLYHKGNIEEQFLDFIYIGETKQIEFSPMISKSKELRWFSVEELETESIKVHVKNTAITVLNYIKSNGGKIMADIKTHLRELSVATTVGIVASGKELHLSDMYDSRNFLALARSVICNDISSANNLLDYPKFTGELRTIVDNGFKLGIKILEGKEFHISEKPVIRWLGNDTQKGDPIDIVIDDYAFSLKEESFILKNMGLYTFLNNLTGSNYVRGLHVFSSFALKEYDDWFSYTWNCFISYLCRHKSWLLRSGSNVSEAFLSGESVVLKYNRIISTVPQDISTNREFMTNTVAWTREKVFSKWINHEISNDAEYLRIKHKCSVTAGKRVCDKINSEFSAENVFEFFQIYPFEYYYAKTTPIETTILKVPAQVDFDDVIEFKGCTYDVPSSQLNIISTFENINTGKTLQFRNECRFSHGQFNGTPEAKMYVVRDTPLTEIYEPIE